MMSILALTGLAFGAGAEAGSDTHHDVSDAFGDPEHWAAEAELRAATSGDLLDDFSEGNGDIAEIAPVSDVETVDLYRGGAIDGFNPASDRIELEYLGALGIPEITLHSADNGASTSIAMDGVIVAKVAGADTLRTEDILLTAV